MRIAESKKKSIYKTYMIYFICMICFLAVRIAYSNGLLSFNNTQTDSIVSTLIIQVGIMFLLPLTLYCIFIRVKPKKVLNTCNYYKLNGGAILISFLIGILVFIINIAASTFFGAIIAFFGYKSAATTAGSADTSFASFILELVITALLPALCEEFLHRGILIQGTKHAGFKRAIFISALMFGFMHFNINQFFYATIVGVVLGLISVVSKNIWPAIIVHFTNNAIGVYLTYANANGWFGGGFYSFLDNIFNTQSYFAIFLITFVSLCLVFIALTYLIFLLYKMTIFRQVEKAVNKVYSSKSVFEQNSPISIKENMAIRSIVESTTTLNLDFEEMKSPIEAVLPKQVNKYQTTLKDRIFLIGSVVLGAVVTFFTFIWWVIY